MTMNFDKKKIITYSIIAIVASVAGYFVYNYYRLKAIYETALSLEEAQKAIENPNVPLIELPDQNVEDAIDQAVAGEANLYTENDVAPSIAIINNVEYKLQEDGTYLEPNNGWIYDAENDSLTHDGQSYFLDPTLVTYK